MEARVGFWPRLGAYLLDLVLLVVLALALKNVVAAWFPGAVAELLAKWQESPGALKLGENWAATVVAITVLGPFYALVEGLWGKSPAKWLLGLRIAAASNHKPRLSRLLLRFALKGSGTILGALAVVAGLGLLETAGNLVGFVFLLGCFLVFRRSRQALHDQLARTIVLRKADFLALPPEQEAVSERSPAAT